MADRAQSKAKPRKAKKKQVAAEKARPESKGTAAELKPAEVEATLGLAAAAREETHARTKDRLPSMRLFPRRRRAGK